MSLPHHHPAPRRVPRRTAATSAIVVALATALLGTACERAPAVPAEPEAPRLGTVRRLAENGIDVPLDERLEERAFKFLGSTAHPTLTGTRWYRPEMRCAPFDRARADDTRPCSATKPATMPAAPHAIAHPYDDPAARSLVKQLAMTPVATPATEPIAQTAPSPTPATTPPGVGKSYVLEGDASAVSVGELTESESARMRLFPAPALAERTLTTETFQVPSGALLRLSLGIEEPAWSIDSAPVYFRVVMIEEPGGTTQDLFRRVLDPARREQDRRWFDADVDLTDLAGKKIRLQFLSEPLHAGDQRPSLPVWGDPRLLATVSGSARPSVVLISLDTMRAKSMSTYGYGLETSPNVTALAAQGALFENAFTTYSNTLPAHMSMLTGLYPASHGVFPGGVLKAEDPTLAEVLRHAGFATAAFTEDAQLDSRRGFRRGFSHYYENSDIDTGIGDAAGTFGRALEWAGRHSDEPFFLFVHTYQVHGPYEPLPPYDQAFGTDVDPSALAQRRYEQEIRYTDDVLRRFLDGLRKVVPQDDLLIVVTADHGEEFGEHGLLTHNQLYDEVMHVPLVMTWPGTIPAGLRITTPVSLVDLTPTILDLVEVSAPKRVDGVSLLPLLASPPGAIERDVVLAEYPDLPGIPERRFVARSTRAKCILSERGTDEKCFDLERDPGEHQPRGVRDTAELTRVAQMADKYRRRALAARPVSHPGAHPTHAEATHGTKAPAGTPPEADGPIERKLRALGYVD